MNFKKLTCCLLWTFCVLALAMPALADDGDSAVCIAEFGYPCFFQPSSEVPNALWFRDLSRPGTVMVFPEFVRGGSNPICGIKTAFLDGTCLPRTEIKLGATCPTRFTAGFEPATPCPEHEAVRVRFRWVCPGTAEHRSICKTDEFDVALTVNGKIVFTANGARLPDKNQVNVPAAPCERGYLIGWVIDHLGRPIKYDGLIGEAVIRESGTAAAVYRGIPIQAQGTTPPGGLIDLFPDPLDVEPDGLFFSGAVNQYRLVTAQVTGDVTFDKGGLAAGIGSDTTTSLILLTLDVRSNSPNFPTRVRLEFWNGFERELPTSVEVKFVCWGEFQLSKDIDPRLTQAFMGTRDGIVQSDEAVKVEVPGISDVAGTATLLGLVQTNEGLLGTPLARTSQITELYNNGIRFWSGVFFP